MKRKLPEVWDTKPPPPKKKSALPLEPEMFSATVEAWANKCKYECPRCSLDEKKSKVFHSHAALREHMGIEHAKWLKPEINLADFVSGCRTETLLLICGVCRKAVVRDRVDLAPHFKRHGKTVEGYFQEFVNSLES